LRLGVK